MDDWRHRHLSHKKRSGCGSHEHGPPGSHPQTARFSKASLKQATILGQVDRKFVACILRASATGDQSAAEEDGKPTLVLVDQHAADERIRVERFLEKLCSASHHTGDDDHISEETTGQHNAAGDLSGSAAFAGPAVRQLDPPVRILLTRHEAEQLAGSDAMQTAFRLWGVRFESGSLQAVLSPPTTGRRAGKEKERDETGYAQIEVESVPEVVAPKVRLLERA